MSGPGADPLTELLELARRLLAADRVEASLAGSPPVVAGSSAYDPEAVVRVLVDDDEGLLAELRIYGASEAPDRELLHELASVAAAVADGDRQVGREEVWVGRLGHDLKTPLTAVLGFSGLLAGGGLAGASPVLTAAAVEVVETGERLLDELEDLLITWRRPDAG